MTTLSKIEAFIENLAETAAKDDTAVDLKIEAAKVLSPYYSALKKAQPADDESPDQITIGDLQRQVHDAEAGNGRAVSSRRRRRTDA